MTPRPAIEMGQGTIENLLSLLSTSPQIWYRLALVRPAGYPWFLHTLLVDVLPPAEHSSQDQPFSYDYRDVYALGGTLAGAEVTSLLQLGGKLAEMSDPVNPMLRHEFGLPPSSGTLVAGSATWFRFPSRSIESMAPWPWPHTRHEVSIERTSSYPFGQEPRHLLIAEGCPFFPDLETLIASLVYGMPRDRFTGVRLSDPAIIIRIADGRSWIDHVEASSTSIRVSVRGSDLRGVHLHVSRGLELYTEVDLQRIQREDHDDGSDVRTVTLPLGGEVSSPPWVLLAHGTDWRDHRIVSTQWMPFQANEPGVTITPPDLPLQIQQYVYQGEGPRIEFKHQPPQTRDQREKLMKTVAAFANGDGGVILVGVEDDTGTIVGINETALPEGSILRLRDGLVDMIHATVVPEPEIDIQHCEMQNKLVLVVYVNEGMQRPYGLNLAKTVFYVRRGATTFPARPDDVRALVQQAYAGPTFQRR